MPVWETILAAGWAPEYAAGCVFNHMYCDQPQYAKWYHERLLEMMRGELMPPNCERPSARSRAIGRAAAVVDRLYSKLTAPQLKLLRGAA